MAINNTLFYSINHEDLRKIWKRFSDEINGKFIFKEPIRANVNVPTYVYEINAKLKDFDLKVNQTVYIHPYSNDQPTLLTYCLTRKTNQKIYFRIWKRDFFEKLLGLNKINSGIDEFDKKYSVKTNTNKITKLIISNDKLRNKIISSKVHFHIETKNQNLELVLKRAGVSKSTEDFSSDIELLKIVTQEIASL